MSLRDSTEAGKTVLDGQSSYDPNNHELDGGYTVYILETRSSLIEDNIAAYEGNKLDEKERGEIAKFISDGNKFLLFQSDEQKSHDYLDLLHDLRGKFSKQMTIFRNLENPQSQINEKRYFILDAGMEGYWKISEDQTKMTRVELLENVLVYEFLFQKEGEARKTRAVMMGDKQNTTLSLLDSNQYMPLKGYGSDGLGVRREINGPYIPNTFYVEIISEDNKLYTRDIITGL